MENEGCGEEYPCRKYKKKATETKLEEDVKR